MNGLEILFTLLGGLGVILVGSSVFALGLQARNCKIPFWKPIIYSAGIYVLAYVYHPPPAFAALIGWQPTEIMDSVRVLMLGVLMAFTVRSIIEDHKRGK